MRIKEKYALITFQTTAQAMAMEKYCMAHQIEGRLIPVPREITAGCGLAWRIRAEAYPAFRGIMDGIKTGFEGVYELWL